MGQRPIAIRLRANTVNMGAGSAETYIHSGSFTAHDTGLGTAEGILENHASMLSETVCSISEAARRLGVSERTIFRLLKTGELERVEPDANQNSIDSNVDYQSNTDIVMSDMNQSWLPKSKQKYQKISFKMSDKNKNMTDNDVFVRLLQEQVREKDIQISHLLRSQQDMAQTIQRLQEQMFELAHLVLAHNVAAAQAKTESELNAKEQVSRRGLANLLSSRIRK